MFIDRKANQLLNTLKSWDYEVTINSDTIELRYESDSLIKESFTIILDYYHFTLMNDTSRDVDFSIYELRIFTELIEYIRTNCK